MNIKQNIVLGLLLSTKIAMGELSFQHHDWQVVCDNTNSCRIAGYSSDTDSHRVSVLLTRKAGERQEIKAELQLGSYGEEERDIFKKFPIHFKLEMIIDEKSYGFVNMNKETFIGSLSKKQTDALIDAVKGYGQIAWKEKKDIWELSNDGASAVLLKADEFQKRLDTIGAFYKKGKRNEKNVLKAKSKPIIYAQKAFPKKRVHLNKKEMNILESNLSSSEEFCFENGEYNIELYKLSATKLVASNLTWTSAYNSGSCFWLINNKPPFKPQFIGDDASGYYVDENQFAIVSSSQKWRGLGDCWSYRTEVWNGKVFKLTSSGNTGLCRLIAGGGAWNLPTFVSIMKVK